jgi:hypothetical protein
MTNYSLRTKSLLDAVAILWKDKMIDDITFKRLNSEIITKENGIIH